MILEVYSVYDKAVNAYMQPFFVVLRVKLSVRLLRL